MTLLPSARDIRQPPVKRPQRLVASGKIAGSGRAVQSLTKCALSRANPLPSPPPSSGEGVKGST